MGLEGERIDKSVQRIGLIIDYLRENNDAFTASEKSIILSNLNNDGTVYGIPNVCLQIYDELGILPEDINSYKAFAKLVDEQFNIKDKNVIEIGGGNIPRLGIRIANMQDKGTITVYDPNLYIREDMEYPNLKLVNRRFTPLINVSKADLLIGLLPCGSSSTIIKSALRYKKDFMIAICDSCNFYEYFDGYEDNTNWPYDFIENISKPVEENNLGKVKIKYVNEIGENYPIIYNDRG